MEAMVLLLLLLVFFLRRPIVRNPLTTAGVAVGAAAGLVLAAFVAPFIGMWVVPAYILLGVFSFTPAVRKALKDVFGGDDA